MYGRSAHREDAAREHPVRAAILVLLAGDERAMNAAEIRAALPDGPARAAIAYHLKILEAASLVSATNGYYELSL